MNIYYISYYKAPEIKNCDFEISPASQQKSAYIISKLDCLGEKYTVVNMAEYSSKKGTFLPLSMSLAKNGTYVVWSSFGKPNRAVRRAHYIFRRIQLMRFLSKLNEKDLVIVYHSLQTADILFKYKNKRRFKFILELEEIYQDVIDCGKKRARWEKKVVSAADGYILSAEVLSAEIPQGHPYIVVNGTYHAEPERNVSFNDGKIHCVYAGTFDPIKAGAAAAAAAAEFLPEEYHVHILGFGTEEQKKKLMEQIQSVQKKAKCTLTYDGLKSGEEYIQFLQKCQIGLCTQIPDAKYTETSFPSKVLVYLANGLRVLSVRIPAVENSEVGSILYYYDSQEPREIAEAIMNIPIDEGYNSRRLLNELDMKCGKNLKWLMEKVNDELN